MSDSTTITTKYRGGTVYFQVFSELIRAAQYRGTTTYQDIATIMGLPSHGSYMGAETGHILGEISEDEVRAGRPMLSAVAVGVSGSPGSGFYSAARKLGLLTSPIDDVGFWEDQRAACYEAWKRHIPESGKVAHAS